ncbi:MAG TPA: hypothetical protein VFK69_02735 [Candidatus Eisenbacteria bacterium]|nr:hypothetical protein [Candidatus Eisenbacteria bacterium]
MLRFPPSRCARARRGAIIGLLAAVALGGTAHRARSQCSQWVAGPLGSTVVGADSAIRAMQVWDPDGAGPAAPLLVVGGSFHSINGVAARHVATWDGLVWRALGAGPSASVSSLAVYNGQLVAGGTSSLHTADIELWDGASWNDLDRGYLTGAPDTVFALTTYGGTLIAAGHIGTPSNIAAFNGTSWQPLAGGGTSGTVYCLTVANNALYAGGAFTGAGAAHAKFIARYDGASWSAVDDGSGNGPAQPVLAMATHGTDLFVGVAEPAAAGVVRWTGTSWQSAGSLCSSVFALGESGGLLYAGGDFYTQLGCSLNRIALWNGSSWTDVGSGIDSNLQGTSLYVRALCSYGGTLFAGGDFHRGGTTDLYDVGQWTGASWVAPDAPLHVYALGTYGAKLAMGGYFSQHINAADDYYLCTWDGNQLAALGAGTDAPIYALKGYSDLVQGQTRNNLIVGGGFTHAGGLDANHVALWSESPVFPFNAWSRLGSGFDNTVLALEQFGGATVAGGAFVTSGATAVTRVARWDGSAWQPMGTGMNAAVHALKAYTVNSSNIALVAGGEFTIANGGAASRVAIWTQSTVGPGFTPWSALGGGLNDTVFAVERYNGSTYAGGAFTSSSTGAVHHVARWNGSAWVAVGSTPGGGCNGTVYALKADGGSLYALGTFTSADGVSAMNAARWNGSAWSAVDVGVNNSGRALVGFNGEMIAGGDFTWAESFAIDSPGMARFLETGTPWIWSQPASQAITAGQTAGFDVEVPTGYEAATYAWRKDGVPLVDGFTPWGSYVDGSQRDLIDIFTCAPADSGSYDCVVSDACGSVTSHAATLTVNAASDVPDGHAGGSIALQVEPNPAAGAATIDLVTARPARGVVAIYDSRGRRVRHLLDATVPGARRLVWDGRDDRGRSTEPGVYFVRASVNGRSVTRRVALIR